MKFRLLSLPALSISLSAMAAEPTANPQNDFDYDLHCALLSVADDQEKHGLSGKPAGSK
jgi:hypothetical protein